MSWRLPVGVAAVVTGLALPAAAAPGHSLDVAPDPPTAAEQADPADQAWRERILPLPVPSVRPTSEDPLTVYLVTAEPGDAVWERFGHNGIWIANALTGENTFWEWGLFSFEQEGFMPRLARGTMRYRMGGRRLRDMLAVYAWQDRRVWAQELRLTPGQKRLLQERVEINALPANQYYTYDYYTDNCSTRVRDALDGVLGGVLREEFGDASAGVSWRWHTRRLLRDMPLAEAGVQVVLGNPGDAIITEWEEMFLPVRLKEHLGRATVNGPGGELPLVLSESQLVRSDRPAPAASPALRLPWALLLGLVLAGCVVLAAGSSRPRLGGLVLAGWMGLAGLLGTVLIVAWIFTDHDFWRWNENVLLLNPVYLVGAVAALPLVASGRRGALLERVVQGCAAVSILAVVLKVLPGLDQGNLDVVALVLPVNLALVVALRRMGGGAVEGGSGRAAPAAGAGGR